MKKLLYIVFMFVGMGLIASCSDDDNVSGTRDGGNGQNEYTIYLDKDILDVKHVGDSYEVKIRSNGNWTAEVVNAQSNGWVTITGGSGNKDVEGVFTVSLEANTGDDIRTANIKIKAGTATTNLNVLQRPKDGKWMLFDRAAVGQYYAEYNKKGALATFKLTGGEIDAAGNITGKAYVMTVNCYVPFADDPNRGEISGAQEYKYAEADDEIEPYTLVSRSQYAESFIDMYDGTGVKSRFVLSEGSTMKSVCYDNDYRLSGQFVDEAGNTVDWYFNGKMTLANTLNQATDTDGNIVIGETGLLTLEYYGDIDDTETGRLYMDVRDMGTSTGLRLWFYITLPVNNENAHSGMIDLGEYPVVSGGAVRTVAPGVNNTSTATSSPSFSYYADGNINLDKLVSGGTMTINKYDKYSGEYDILFDLKGKDANGVESQLTKYRYIGKLPIKNNKVAEISFTPRHVKFYYDGEVTGLANTGRYRFEIASNSDKYARLVDWVQAEFYGPLPTTATDIMLPEGTYTKANLADNSDAVSGQYLNSYGSSFNPKGTIYRATGDDSRAYISAVTRGDFTISVDGTKTTIDLNLTTVDQLGGGGVAKIRFSHTANYVYCNE